MVFARRKKGEIADGDPPSDAIYNDPESFVKLPATHLDEVLQLRTL